MHVASTRFRTHVRTKKLTVKIHFGTILGFAVLYEAVQLEPSALTPQIVIKNEHRSTQPSLFVFLPLNPELAWNKHSEEEPIHSRSMHKVCSVYALPI